MTKVLVIFIAFAFGLLAFATFQETDLPAELEFLTHQGGSAVLAPEVGAFSERRLSNGWLLRAQGASVELIKRFNGEIVTSEGRFDVPTIGLLCQAPRLDARIDSRIATTGTTHTEVSINGAAPSRWVKGTGTNLFPPNPQELIRALASAAQPTVVFTFDFEHLGKQRVELEVDALDSALRHFSATCFNP